MGGSKSAQTLFNSLSLKFGGNFSRLQIASFPFAYSFILAVLLFTAWITVENNSHCTLLENTHTYSNIVIIWDMKRWREFLLYSLCIWIFVFVIRKELRYPGYSIIQIRIVNFILNRFVSIVLFQKYPYQGSNPQIRRNRIRFWVQHTCIKLHIKWNRVRVGIRLAFKLNGSWKKQIRIQKTDPDPKKLMPVSSLKFSVITSIC